MQITGGPWWPRAGDTQGSSLEQPSFGSACGVMGNGHPRATNALWYRVMWMNENLLLAGQYSQHLWESLYEEALLLCLKCYLPELRTALSLVRKDTGWITQGNGNIQEKRSKGEH